MSKNVENVIKVSEGNLSNRLHLRISNRLHCALWNNKQWKKPSERRKHCALAVVRRAKNSPPPQTPSLGGAGWPKFNQLEMVTTFTYRPSLVKIDARNLELSW